MTSTTFEHPETKALRCIRAYLAAKPTSIVRHTAYRALIRNLNAAFSLDGYSQEEIRRMDLDSHADAWIDRVRRED